MRSVLWLTLLALGNAACSSGGSGGGYGAAPSGGYGGSGATGGGFPSGPMLDCQPGDLDIGANSGPGTTIMPLPGVPFSSPITIAGQPAYESNPVSLCVPPDAVGMVLFSDTSWNVLASSYVASGLGEIVDTATPESLMRVQAPELMLPKGPEVQLHPGRHTFKLAGQIVGEAWPRLGIRRGARAPNNQFGLNLILVNGSGIDGTNAEAFGNAGGLFEQIYAQVGVAVTALGVGVIDDLALSVIPVEQEQSLAQAPVQSAPEAPLIPSAINFYFVRELISSDSAGTLLGHAMGIPGAPGIPEKSGVVISVDAHRNGLDLDFAAIWVTAAHEGGHWHGLRHTSERWGTIQDLVADTPECAPNRDFNKDGLVDSGECSGFGAQNLMFWTYDPRNPPSQLTPGQGFVLASALSIVPQ